MLVLPLLLGPVQWRSAHTSSACTRCSWTQVSPRLQSLSTNHTPAQFSKHSRRRPCRGLNTLRALQLPSEKAAGQVQGVEDDAGMFAAPLQLVQSYAF